jgi:hypothetical protein
MTRSTMPRVLWAALGAVAIVLGATGCEQKPSVHSWADVPEAKKKGKFEIGPGKAAPKGRPAAAAGSHAKPR